MAARFRTVKRRISFLMLLFTVIVTLMITASSYFLVYSFQRKTIVQSAEFNLQLVSSLIQEDIASLAGLASWVGHESDVPRYFLANHPRMLATDTHTQLRTEYLKNRASNYVHRLIAANNDRSLILQVGRYASTGIPVNRYSIYDISMIPENWSQVIQDPYYPSQYVVPYSYHVYDPSDLSVLGDVYMLISTELITDKLRNYNLTEGAALYLSFGDNTYLVDGMSLLITDVTHEILTENTTDPNSPLTYAAAVRTDEGVAATLIRYPVRDGITITHVMPNNAFAPGRGLWTWLIAGLGVLVLMMALIVMRSLNRNISLPVARLRKRIDAIAGGDFSRDPSIEIDSEIGEVGRGINHLSHEVAQLMDRRLADEKVKRDLEYSMLQSQMNPHFIYNTLNSIKWMATLQNATGIAEMTTSLSRLLKSAAKDIRKVVPLREELALLDDYFLIQKYRYGGAITLITEIENTTLLDCEIPRFALQPLVENSIFHGIEPKGSGEIRLSVTAEAETVAVTITDNGVGMSAGQIQAVYEGKPSQEDHLRRLGVKSVHDRIRYAFGEEKGLEIKSEEGRYTAMTLRIPGPVRLEIVDKPEDKQDD